MQQLLFFCKKYDIRLCRTAKNGEPASRRWVRGAAASDFPQMQTLPSRPDERSRWYNVDSA